MRIIPRVLPWRPAVIPLAWMFGRDDVQQARRACVRRTQSLRYRRAVARVPGVQDCRPYQTGATINASRWTEVCTLARRRCGWSLCCASSTNFSVAFGLASLNWRCCWIATSRCDPTCGLREVALQSLESDPEERVLEAVFLASAGDFSSG